MSLLVTHSSVADNFATNIFTEAWKPSNSMKVYKKATHGAMELVVSDLIINVTETDSTK